MERYDIKNTSDDPFWVYAEILEDPNGEWVKYSEAEKLELRVKGLEEALKEYKSMVGNTGYSIGRDEAMRLYDKATTALNK